MSYKCCGCERKFDEPNILQTTYEEYYGAPLPTRTYLKLELCPCCGCEDFNESGEEDEIE